MRTASFICAILLSSFGLCAQSCFSVIHLGDSSSAGDGHSIFGTSYGYLLFSAEVDQNTGHTWLYTSRFDFEGEFIGGRTFAGPRNFDSGQVDCIARAVNGEYLAALSSFQSGTPDSLFLYRFNEAGDTLYTQFVSSEASRGVRDCISLDEIGDWVCGWCTTSVDPVVDVACIAKYDQNGQEVVRRTWSLIDRFYTMAEMEDGHFLLGGGRSSSIDRTVLIKVNSEGVEVWTRYHGGYASYSGASGHGTLMSNGNYLVPGSYLPIDSTDVIERCFASLYCYSPEGDLLWRKDLLWGRLAVAVLSRPAGNGEYWVVGGYYQIPRDPDLAATIWRVNNDGDTLFTRKYWYYGGEESVNAASYGMDTTSDGGVIFTGLAREGFAGAEPYVQKTWILKLDQYGCLLPGCQNVGVQDYEMALTGALQLAPNPASERLSVQLQLPDGYRTEGGLQILLLDV